MELNSGVLGQGGMAGQECRDGRQGEGYSFINNWTRSVHFLFGVVGSKETRGIEGPKLEGEECLGHMG